ncbi:MAG: histidine triad nucleotide-binding protein [Acidobacteriota bacterium]
MAEQDTIFHKIITGDAPAQIVYEDEEVVAFKDVNPQAPVHIILIPRNTDPESLNDVSRADERVLGHLLFAAAKVANKEGIAESGYRVVINTGAAAGQSVDYLHVHLLGGRDMTWPPG